MNRRQTLAAVLSDSTNIPQSSNNSKSNSWQNSRLSLNPSKSRSRHSTQHMSGLVDSMQNISIAKNDILKGNMANRQSTARTSIYGRPSNMGHSAQALTKDPRPIREKSWQGNAIRSLITFLVDSGYNQSAISLKSLQAPSSKDFQLIFKFLYAQLDPHFQFKKKIEEDVHYVLKMLKYPFADSITKSLLYSAGSLHAWPTLLAMVTWLVELILCCAQADTHNDIDTPLDDVQLSERIFFDYLKKSYSVFLDTGAETDPIMDTELAKNFDRKNEFIIKEIQKLKKDCDSLEREWEGLTGTDSPLIRIECEKERLESEREQYKDTISQLESSQQKLHDSILALAADLEMIEADCAHLQNEKIQLQDAVDSQEISPADVDRMNSERDQLVKSLETVSSKLDILNQDIWDKEISIQKTMDQLEKCVQNYNTRSYKLGILGSKNPEFAHVKNELELQIHASNPDKMVSLDLKNKVKPTLANLKVKYNNMFHKYQEETIAIQELIDNLNWNVSQKDEDLKVMEARIKGLSDRYKEEKEHIGLTLVATTDEIENYEKQIQRLKIQANNNLLISQQKCQKMAVEFETLSRQYNEQKEKMVNQVVSGLVEVFNFQQYVNANLEDLKKEMEDECNQANSLSNTLTL